METIIKREFILEGLCCANCANKIEAQCKKLDGVLEANMNFINKNLVIQFQSEEEILSINDEIKKIVKRIEPGVKLVPNNVNTFNHEEKESDHCDCHDHGHKHEDEGNNKSKIIRFAVGVAFFIIAVLFKLNYLVEFALFLVSYLLIGGDVLLVAARNIFRGELFDENFLMSLATIGAFSIGQYPEGVGVMLFYQVGEFFQEVAVNKSRKSISALMDIRPDYANKKFNDEIVKLDPEEVHIGDIIVVKPGEKVPLDGVVMEGISLIDTAALTGESVPREVKSGDQILAGCINKNGLLTIEVKKEFGESTLAKILDLVQNASSKKAPTENFVTKFAKYYTPIVVVSATVLAIIPPLLIPGASFSQWIYRALVFLVVSCPCALVISIPLGFFGGIGGASKNGILVKGGNYLEALNSVEVVVFDKTGTLTKGVFVVTEMKAEGEISKDELLEYAAYVESNSNHPIAISILKAYGKEIRKEDIEDVSEIAGKGIRAKIKGKYVLAGNSNLIDT